MGSLRAICSGSYRVVAIHADLYGRLPETDRVTEDAQVVVPGEYRTRPVSAGRHVAPPADHLAALMAAWAKRTLGCRVPSVSSSVTLVRTIAWLGCIRLSTAMAVRLGSIHISCCSGSG